MNIITIAEIKRGGMAALDAALNAPQNGGMATIMKRNRPAAVVLTPQAYEALLVSVGSLKRNGTALDWLLATDSAGANGIELDAIGMAQRLNDIRAGWPER